jgi:hypothetical protein
MIRHGVWRRSLLSNRAISQYMCVAEARAAQSELVLAATERVAHRMTRAA